MLVKIRNVVYNDNRGEFMESYSIIVLLFGILSFFLLVMVYFVNRIFQYGYKINNRFLAVKDLLDERVDIIEEMIEFLKNNLEHEKSYQNKLIQMKDIILGVNNNKEGIDNYKKTEKDVLNFVKLEKTYQNLIKNNEYLKIKEEILKNQDRIVYAMDSYDKGVINYNNYKEKKLVYWLSKLCRVPEYGCYNK